MGVQVVPPPCSTCVDKSHKRRRRGFGETARIRVEQGVVKRIHLANLAALEARLMWRFAGAMLAQTPINRTRVIS